MRNRKAVGPQLTWSCMVYWCWRSAFLNITAWHHLGRHSVKTAPQLVVLGTLIKSLYFPLVWNHSSTLSYLAGTCLVASCDPTQKSAKQVHWTNTCRGIQVWVTNGVKPPLLLDDSYLQQPAKERAETEQGCSHGVAGLRNHSMEGGKHRTNPDHSPLNILPPCPLRRLQRNAWDQSEQDTLVLPGL